MELETNQTENTNQTEEIQKLDGTGTDVALEKEEIPRFFIKKGFLLDKETLDFFSDFGDLELCEEILNRIVALSGTRMISKVLISAHFEEIEPLFLDLEDQRVKMLKDFFKSVPVLDPESGNEIDENKEEKESVKNIKKDFRILTSVENVCKKIEVKDFVVHFKNRYNFLKNILRGRKELANVLSIDKIGNNRDFSIIGLVSSKRITKNKNLLMEVEDLTGRRTVLVNQSKPEVFEKARGILLDDVIGLKCSGNSEITFVNDLFFADAAIEERKKFDEEVYALFASDIHLGSVNFLEKNFARFIDWLNGVGCNEEQKEKIKKIKYLFFTGDNVDGVGVFPGQEAQLTIKDIAEQYVKLASYLKKVPKHITMIMCPGQHDAVRVPEPQLAVDKDFGGPLLEIENLVLVDNPTMVQIGLNDPSGGIKILMYHGASLHSWINEIDELRIGKTNLNPSKGIKYLLKHRHLSPTHSATTYVPDEKEDPMVIKEVPDIMITGDMHRSDLDTYNNILIICSSCWQTITPFEEKVGNQPDLCKVPMLNLKTREVKILDFS